MDGMTYDNNKFAPGHAFPQACMPVSLLSLGGPMRNRILSLTRSTIPYVKELLPLAHSLAGCILMQQLDYWFERKSNGFYKFLEPCDNQLCQLGQSWVEELGISAVEFRTTFDRFATRYKSKSEFDRAPDKFQGKFYCSYHDKRAQLTWYFRNHELLDKALDDLLMVQKPTDPTENGGQTGAFRPNPPVSAPPPVPVTSPAAVPVNAGNAFPVAPPVAATGNAAYDLLVSAPNVATVSAPGEVRGASLSAVLDPRGADIMQLAEQQTSSTETPTEHKRPQPQTEAPMDLDESCSSGMELVFPSKASPQERSVLVDLLAGCTHASRQAVLDELEGYSRAGKITAGMVPLARSLVRAVGDGKFAPNFGLAVSGDREKRQRHAEVLASVQAPLATVTLEAMNEQGLAMLPPALRRMAEASVKREGR